MTMRHTWHNVMRLEDEKKEVLSKVFSHNSLVICVGYSFMDRDLRGLILSPFLNPQQDEDKKLIIVTKKESDKKYDIRQHEPINILLNKNNNNIHIFSFDKGADYFFEEFSKHLFNKPWDEYYPGIEKHRARYLITSSLINNKLSNYRENAKIIEQEFYDNINKHNIKYRFNKIDDYIKIMQRIFFLYQKLRIEVILFIASVKGKFRGAVLLESPRIKRYYEGIESLVQKLPKDFQPHIMEKHSIRSLFEEMLYGKMPKNELGEEPFFWEFGRKISPDRAIDLFADTLVGYCKLGDLKKKTYDEIKDCMKSITERLDITLVRQAPRLIAFKRPYIICE